MQRAPLVFISVILIVAISIILVREGDYGVNAIPSEEELAIRAAQLDAAGTNVCGGLDHLDGSIGQLQGACCGSIDPHRYAEQLRGLRAYASNDLIPQDPYDMDRGLAERLLAYDEELELTASQQRIFDEATELSGEGGPCCCRCWRYYAFRGQAKVLISEQGWDAHELAELWELQDGCGGAGHSGHGHGGHGHA